MSFSSSRLAHQKDTDVHRTDTVDHLADMGHALRGEDQSGGTAVRFLAKRAVFLFKFVHAKAALDDELEDVDLDRLGNEIECASGNGAHRVGAFDITARDDDLGIGETAQNLVENPQSLAGAIFVRRQTEIEDHNGIGPTSRKLG